MSEPAQTKDLFPNYRPLNFDGLLSDLNLMEDRTEFLTLSSLHDCSEINLSHAKAVELRDWLIEVLASLDTASDRDTCPGCGSKALVTLKCPDCGKQYEGHAGDNCCHECWKKFSGMTLEEITGTAGEPEAARS